MRHTATYILSGESAGAAPRPSLNNVGNSYRSLGEHARALEYHRRSRHTKVRDEHGRWGRFDAYVQERTDAVVTHSICPDCKAANFP